MSRAARNAPRGVGLDDKGSRGLANGDLARILEVGGGGEDGMDGAPLGWSPTSHK